MKTFSPKKIIDQGRDDRDNGVPFAGNPYRFTSRQRQGVFKAAYWEAGWNERDKELRRKS